MEIHFVFVNSFLFVLEPVIINLDAVNNACPSAGLLFVLLFCCPIILLSGLSCQHRVHNSVKCSLVLCAKFKQQKSLQ